MPIESTPEEMLKSLTPGTELYEALYSQIHNTPIKQKKVVKTTNYKYIKKYLKKRYQTDEEFRKKRILAQQIRNRKILSDPVLRAKWNEYYKERSRQKTLLKKAQKEAENT
jgi:hypothetical protein